MFEVSLYLVRTFKSLKIKDWDEIEKNLRDSYKFEKEEIGHLSGHKIVKRRVVLRGESAHTFTSLAC